MAENPTVKTRVMKYQVSAVSYGSIDYDLFSIDVEDTGLGLWAVRLRSRCLGADGEWDWEPLPSSREDDWLATHRFPLEEALRRAEVEALRIEVNGYTVADILAKEARRG